MCALDRDKLNCITILVIFLICSKSEGINEEHCVLTTEEAEDSPWTATIKLEDPRAIGTGNYFSGVILDEYTIVTCGKAFHALTDKLQFLAWGNYSINAGPISKTSRPGGSFEFNQTVPVSFIQPHPKYNNKWNGAYWMFSENFYIIIHLKKPLTFNRHVKPACWPKIIDPDANPLIAENSTALLGGWIKSAVELTKTSLNVKFENVKKCKEEWAKRGFTADQNVLPYKNRACGYTTELNTNNPRAQCIDKNSGAFVNDGKGRYEFIGFLNSYYPILDMCDEGTFAFLYLTSKETFEWMNNTMRCGSFNYTCHNGECVSLDTVCNQKQDGCSDGSDENPRYCRALNPCKKDEFECGVYGKCIPLVVNGKEAKNCDGVADCEGSEDEDEEMCRAEIDDKDGDDSSMPPVLIIVVIAVSLIVVIPGFVFGWRRVRVLQLRKNETAAHVEKEPRTVSHEVLVISDSESYTSYESMPRPRGYVRDLTEEEILEFEEGLPPNPDDTEVPQDDPYVRPWDSSTYEIPLENIEKGEKIGFGHFGNIYKAKIKNHPNGEDCVIKIAHTTSDADQMKALLKELKIIIYVGKHENIVKFIGAYTRQIRNRILYIVLEHCEFRSMENFLRTYRSFYNADPEIYKSNQQLLNRENISIEMMPQISEEAEHYVSAQMSFEFSILDLIRWSAEIAAAMEFLANKNVIHGDLAARNVLLDSRKVAKISDFGLSHHLYQSATYIASRESRLPWKWMGPESLLYGTLSTQSDVWSYGVTLWEIFSLGLVPYGGVEWSQGFVQRLAAEGCTLGQPAHATDKIYKIMQQCWTIEPNDRPGFTFIKDLFQKYFTSTSTENESCKTDD